MDLLKEEKILVDLKEKVKEQEKKIADFKAMPDAQRTLGHVATLADLLHEKQCHWNHTDGCSWFCEKWTDKLGEYSAKASYLKKAKEILKDFTFEQAIKFVAKM